MDESDSVKEGKVSSFVKFGLYFINWLFLIMSAFSMAIGFYVYWKLGNIQVLIDVDFKPDNYIIVLGVLLFVIGCVGYVATMQENTCILYWYLLALLLLLLLYVPIGSTAFSITTEGFKRTEGVKEIWMTLRNYYEIEESRKVIDEIQRTLQCCGLTDYGYQDWNHNIEFECEISNETPQKCSVPASCCKMGQEDNDPKCGANILNTTLMSETEIEEIINTNGCLNALNDLLKQTSSVLGFVSLGTSIVVVVGMLLTIIRLIILGRFRVSFHRWIRKQRYRKSFAAGKRTFRKAYKLKAEDECVVLLPKTHEI